MKKNEGIFTGIVIGVAAVTLGRLAFKMLMKRRGCGNQLSAKARKMSNYVFEKGVRLTQAQKDLIAETREKFPRWFIMVGGPDVGALLENLIRISGAKRGLEVGVFTGYTTMTMALALPKEDGHILALDISKEWTDVGMKYWKQNKVDNIIELSLGPATKKLDELITDENNLGTYDFAFIDADKTGYDDYYERCLKLLKKGGWILFDNIFQDGYINQDVVPERRKSNVEAIRKLNDKLLNDNRVTISMLEISDGLTLVVKQ